MYSNSYWYFTYHISVKSTGEETRDDAIVQSSGRQFPIADVIALFTEDFPLDTKITILNTIQISAEDYIKLSRRMS